MSRTPALMLQGTGSDVGKSLLAAGLCRAFTRRGLRVRPFKPQNMSNNAAVTADGGEIGRAQALQARACGVALSSHMNPILLKPQSEIGAQVVVQGRVWGNAKAREYQGLKPRFLNAVLESYRRLAAESDLVVIEGAGSAAEVNLRAGDIANMGFAEATAVPVVLVGDIDRGGVIASIVGTHALLSKGERRLLAGYIINKFRGDVSLFDQGLEVISECTDLPCFGVLPFFVEARRLPAEDALAIAAPVKPAADRELKIAVPIVSRISNFDDLDPLIAEPDVSVEFVEPGEALPGDAQLMVLPGSKATLADLAFMRAQGWDIDLMAHRRRGGYVVGLCGGYQMLGRSVSDPGGIEGNAGEAPGLGLLDVTTELTNHKTLLQVEGHDLESGAAVSGYEMHIGVTSGPDRERPMLQLGDRREGAVSKDGCVMGCYLHGLFAADAFRQAFLGRIKTRAASGVAYDDQVEDTLDGLADHLERHLDLERLLEVARGR